MNREDIIRMAQEAAKNYTQTFNWEHILQIDRDIFERFAALVAAAEREACAKVCENIERKGAWITKTEAAAAIRERGEK